MRKSSFATIVLAASMAMVACDDSSSASDEEVPESSESVPKSSGSVPVSSAIPESSNNDALSAYYELFKSSSSFKPDSASCNSLLPSGPPFKCSDSLEVDGGYYYDSGYMRANNTGGCTYKCQQNKWSYVSHEDFPDSARVFTDMGYYGGEDKALIMMLKKCDAENEGLLDSACSLRAKGRCAIHNYYKCEQGSWNYMDKDHCNLTNPKDGDECCRAFTSSSIFYVYTTSYGWVEKGEYDDLECKTPIQEYDVCSEPKEACTERKSGKIDSTTSINSSNTCYILCVYGKWSMLHETAEEVAVRAYCGGSVRIMSPETNEVVEERDYGFADGNSCCYPKTPGSDEGVFYQSSDETNRWEKAGESCKVSEYERPVREIYEDSFDDYYY